METKDEWTKKGAVFSGAPREPPVNSITPGPAAYFPDDPELKTRKFVAGTFGSADRKPVFAPNSSGTDIKPRKDLKSGKK